MRYTYQDKETGKKYKLESEVEDPNKVLKAMGGELSAHTMMERLILGRAKMFRNRREILLQEFWN